MDYISRFGNYFIAIDELIHFQSPMTFEMQTSKLTFIASGSFLDGFLIISKSTEISFTS